MIAQIGGRPLLERNGQKPVLESPLLRQVRYRDCRALFKPLEIITDEVEEYDIRLIASNEGCFVDL